MTKILLYIDPASTSAILYIIVAISATLAFALRGFFYKIKSFVLGKGFVKSDEFENIDIIFYSEGKQYWSVFYPIIKALEKKNIECVYLTSDLNDPGLNYTSENLRSKYIGNLTMTSVYLNKLKAKFVGMTAPQLDVMMIKRSKDVQHYAHIIHSPVDIFVYKKFAFDYFDSVFCSGSHQVENIRFIEEKRKVERKALYEIGLTYYDKMIEDISKIKPKEDKSRPTVLLAPSWKSDCTLNRFGSDFITFLLKDPSYDIILRPHPQTYVSYPEIMQKIETDFKDEKRITIDTAPSGIESMINADVMISDFSGIIWDFAFLFSRPVLILDVPLTLDGFEATELDRDHFWDVNERESIGEIFSEKDIEHISTKVRNLIDNPPENTIKALRDQSVYNWNCAGEEAANQIISIIEDLK
jgi:hypothetical protein